MYTVACVYRKKPGAPYSPIWVERLYKGVKRHATGDYEFVCLTDDMEVPHVEGIEYIPLQHPDWPGRGWWSKLEIFRPATFRKPLVYLDLDTLVVGDVSRLLSDGPFKAPRNYGGAANFCSTAFSVADPQEFTEFYQWFAMNSYNVVEAYDRFRDRSIGDQAYMARMLTRMAKGWDYYSDYLVPSYKHHCRHGYPEKADAVAIAFHGRPKMNELNNWAGTYWQGLA